MLQQIREPVQDDFDAVNALIVDQLHSDVELVENIGHYIVESGGKRLRPLLALLAARTAGIESRDHIALAAVIEFIHTATLLHDDVVDISELRRGKPTANATWGNAPSVLVGDFLYSRAFQMLVTMGNMEVMGVLANTTNLVAEGEVLQLVNQGDPGTTEARYLEVIQRKTAILFEAATRGGALLSGAPHRTVEALADYGLQLGMAFQIVDDMLDYTGDPEQTGKNIGDDLQEGKPTLPLIFLIDQGDDKAVSLVTSAIREKDDSNLGEITRLIQQSGALEYTRDIANHYNDKALTSLEQLPASRYRDALTALVSFNLERTA